MQISAITIQKIYEVKLCIQFITKISAFNNWTLKLQLNEVQLAMFTDMICLYILCSGCNNFM